MADLEHLKKSKPEGGAWAACSLCDRLGTIPKRKNNPTWVQSDDASPEFLEEREDDHSRGSEFCTLCHGKGWLELTIPMGELKPSPGE